MNDNEKLDLKKINEDFELYVECLCSIEEQIKMLQKIYKTQKALLEYCQMQESKIKELEG